MRNILLAALTVSSIALPATVAAADDAPPPTTDHSCPLKSQIDRFTDGDEPETINVWTSPSVGYKVTFASCPNIKWSGIGARLDSRSGGCLSPGDRIIFHARGMDDFCMVTNVERLPPKKPK